MIPIEQPESDRDGVRDKRDPEDRFLCTLSGVTARPKGGDKWMIAVSISRDAEPPARRSLAASSVQIKPARSMFE